MSYLSWTVKFAIFLALIGFAFKNSDPIKLSYWFGYEWTAPLVLVLIAFLVVGILIGLLASLTAIFRLRRQVQALKKEMKLQAAAAPATPSAPAANTNVTSTPALEHPVI